jgi:hypothetical protein
MIVINIIKSYIATPHYNKFPGISEQSSGIIYA